MRKDNDKQETQEAILGAAERLLERYGYSKMTMTDLAEEAGIGVGTTYLYFPGKADVAVAVVERFNTRVRAQLQEIADKPGEPQQKLRDMLAARILIRFETVRNQTHHLDEFKQAVQASIHARRECWMHLEAKIFGQVLQEGFETRVFSFGSAEQAAALLIHATHCLMPRSLSDEDFHNPQGVYQKTEHLVDFLLRALRP